MMKKILKTILVTMMLLTQLQIDKVNAETMFSGGSGTAEDPYLISCADDLIQLSNLTVSDSNKTTEIYNKAYYLQTCDIEMDPEVNFTSICQATYFYGTYDGQGYVIDGMHSESEDYACGLFREVGSLGVVRNVVIGPNCTFSITATEPPNMGGIGSVGSICGFIGTSKKNILIENCVSFATIKSVNVKPKMGGIVGNTAQMGGTGSITISNCYFGGKCIYEGTSTTGYDIAGICGNTTNSITIKECINAGTIEGGKISEVAGIVGFVSGSRTNVISKCINIGDVSSQGNAVGGILGEGGKGLTFKENINLGTIHYADGKTVGSLIGNYLPASSTKSENNLYDGLANPNLTSTGSVVEPVTGMSDVSNLADIPDYDGTIRDFENAIEIAQAFKDVYETINPLKSTVLQFRIDDGVWKEMIQTTDCSIKSGIVHTLSVRIKESAESEKEILSEKVILRFAIKPITVTVDGLTANDKTYDKTADVTFDYKDVVINGAISGDDVQLNATGAFADVNAAQDIQVNISELKLVGEDAISYILDTDNCVKTLSADINRKAINVYPTSGQSKRYGEADPVAFKYTSDVLEGDELTGALARVKGEEVGDYSYTLGTLNNPNYDLLLKSGKFTINKRIPQINVPTDLVGYVGQKLKDIQLPKGFAWQNDIETQLENAGDQTYLLTYTDEDPTYEVLQDISVNINVGNKIFKNSEKSEIVLNDVLLDQNIAFEITTLIGSATADDASDQAKESELKQMNLQEGEDVGFVVQIQAMKNEEGNQSEISIDNLSNIDSLTITVKIPEEIQVEEIARMVNIDEDRIADYNFNANEVDEDRMYTFSGNRFGKYFFIVRSEKPVSQTSSWLRIALPCATATVLLILIIIIIRKKKENEEDAKQN